MNLKSNSGMVVMHLHPVIALLGDIGKVLPIRREHDEIDDLGKSLPWLFVNQYRHIAALGLRSIDQFAARIERRIRHPNGSGI